MQAMNPNVCTESLASANWGGPTWNAKVGNTFMLVNIR